jgi:hypothetical protein
MRATFCAVAAFLIGCAGGPSVGSNDQASQTGVVNGSGAAKHGTVASVGGTNVLPAIRVIPCATAACIGLTQMQQRLDPVQLANDWGRPDLVDQIKVMTDEANATLDPDERDMLIRALYTNLDTLAQ